MQTLSKTISEEEDGSSVRHILKAKLHFSSHAISRLTRTPSGIQVNGRHARTVDTVCAGDIVTVEISDQQLSQTEIVPGNWDMPIIW